MFITGAAVQWLRDGLGIIGSAPESEGLAASLDSNDGVYFVPALTGLGSPHWDPYARGTIIGLTRGSGRAELARAALEAIAYQTVDAVRAQEAAAGEALEVLKADGGAVSNRWLMQFQADVLGAPVVVPQISETTALGAAYLAGIASGVWDAQQVEAMWRQAARYEPRMGEDERQFLLGEWRRAVERAKGWARRPAVSSRVTATLSGVGQHEPAPAGSIADGRDQAPGLQGPPPRRVLHAVPRARSHPRRPTGSMTLARIVLTPPTLLLYRAWAIGTENVPSSGPVILAPNHFSNWDHFFAAVYLRRKVRFMAKSQLLGANRAITFIFSHGGAFPVRRGHQDQEAFITAHAILDHGGCMLIYAGGRSLAHRRARSAATGGRLPGARVGGPRGAGGDPRLAGASGGGGRLQFPKVTIQYGEPLTFEAVERPSREQAQEVAERVFEPVREMYAALEEKGRRGVIKALREGIGARAERQVPAGQPR